MGVLLFSSTLRLDVQNLQMHNAISPLGIFASVDKIWAVGYVNLFLFLSVCLSASAQELRINVFINVRFNRDIECQSFRSIRHAVVYHLLALFSVVSVCLLSLVYIHMLSVCLLPGLDWTRSSSLLKVFCHYR